MIADIVVLCLLALIFRKAIIKAAAYVIGQIKQTGKDL